MPTHPTAPRRDAAPTDHDSASDVARTGDPESDDAAAKIEAMTAPVTAAQEGAAGGLGGMALGALVGSAAGPPGIVAGAIVGAFIGAAAGRAFEENQEALGAEDRRLDRAIGVTEGHIGEASPDQPPARMGLYHSASMGRGGGSDAATCDGPIPTPVSDD